MNSDSSGEISPDDSRSFEQIAEQEARRAMLRVYLREALGTAAMVLTYVGFVILRLGLAVYGAAISGSAVMVAAALIYGSWWAWQIRGMARGVTKMFSEQPSVSPEDEEKAFESLGKIRFYNTPRKALSLLPSLGLSILAGVGVSNLAGAPVGILAGIILLGVSAMAPLPFVGAIKRTNQFAHLLKPGPRDTPES